MSSVVQLMQKDICCLNQHNSNASSHIPTSTHQPSEPESTAGRSKAIRVVSTRRPISVDGHQSAKVVRFQTEEPCGSSDESSISNPTPLAGAVPHPKGKFRCPCLKRPLISPRTTFFETLTTGLCGEDIPYRWITLPVTYFADPFFLFALPPGWAKAQGDLSRSKLIFTPFYWWWFWAKTHPIINCHLTRIVRVNYPACKSVTREPSIRRKRELANYLVFYRVTLRPQKSRLCGRGGVSIDSRYTDFYDSDHHFVIRREASNPNKW